MKIKPTTAFAAESIIPGESTVRELRHLLFRFDGETANQLRRRLFDRKEQDLPASDEECEEARRAILLEE